MIALLVITAFGYSRAIFIVIEFHCRIAVGNIIGYHYICE